MNSESNSTPDEDEDFPFVSVTWMAALAGVSASTMYRRLAADGGGLRVYRVNHRCSVVRRNDAIAWVAKQAA